MATVFFSVVDVGTVRLIVARPLGMCLTCACTSHMTCQARERVLLGCVAQPGTGPEPGPALALEAGHEPGPACFVYMWDLRRWYNRYAVLAPPHKQLSTRIWTSQDARASKLLCTLALPLDCEFPGLVQPSRDAFSRPGLAWPCGGTVLFYTAALVASISECPNEIPETESVRKRRRER